MSHPSLAEILPRLQILALNHVRLYTGGGMQFHYLQTECKSCGKFTQSPQLDLDVRVQRRIVANHQGCAAVEIKTAERFAAYCSEGCWGMAQGPLADGLGFLKLYWPEKEQALCSKCLKVINRGSWHISFTLLKMDYEATNASFAHCLDDNEWALTCLGCSGSSEAIAVEERALELL